LPVLLAALSGPIGCGRPLEAPVIPPTGFLYTHFRAPLVLPGQAAIGSVLPPQGARGVYFRLPAPYVPADFSVGEAGLKQAMEAAGVEELAYADYEYRSVLGFIRTIRVRAHGSGAPRAGESPP